MIVTKETYVLKTPFVLESGVVLHNVVIAFEQYGNLNAEKSNLVLITHGITGSSHAAGKYAESNRSAGYWDDLIGPGKAFDTDVWCVVAPNVLGGCRGSTGPLSIDPSTNQPYGPNFPEITIRDMVFVQRRFVNECFDVVRVACVSGGSMGGFQALEWAASLPDFVRSIIPVATAITPNPRAIAYNHCARTAIHLDPAFADGYYQDRGVYPDNGLSLARMIGTISYLSDASFQDMFHDGSSPLPSQDNNGNHDFLVEGYLNDEGNKLVQRFDANTYLLISKALDTHALDRDRGSLDQVFASISCPILALGFTSDNLFPIRQTLEIVERAKSAGNTDAQAVCIDSDYGHDAFLVHQTLMSGPIRDFLMSVYALL